MIGFDEYTVRARLAPVLIVLLPIMIAVVAWQPTGSVWSSAAAGAIAGLALGGLLAQLGRDLGKKKEHDLLVRWGGFPTAKLLRHRTKGVNAQTLARRHERLRALMPTVRIPSAEEEHADPAAAESAYGSCTDFLREKTRDKVRFPLVFQENVNYGFRRNLWAMKPAGVVLALVGIGATAAAIVTPDSASVSARHLAALGLDVSLLVIWIVRVQPSWVRVAAQAYAERLIGACEEL